MATLFFTKEARIYNGAKTASSINSAGKTDQLHVKNETRTLPNTIQFSSVESLSRVRLFVTP